MAKYFLTNKAVEDLSQIWNYTYEVWSETQADKYYALLINAFDEIVQNPHVGKKYPEIQSDIAGYRVGRHIIFYRSIKPTEVEIVRILHSRMDLRDRMEA